MIKVEKAYKSYTMGDMLVRALDGVSLHIAAGEFVAIMGSSGSGKSTLLNVIGCLDVLDQGDYFLAGEPVSGRSEMALARIRNQTLGFVFQQFHLLPRMDALRNVELPLVYGGVPPLERSKRAAEKLRLVGLGERMHHLPAQLSGGQQQRVAIARALVNEPKVLIADEPTGSLDVATGHEIMRTFQHLNRDMGLTIVMVTHEEDIAHFASRTVRLRDGRIESSLRRKESQ